MKIAFGVRLRVARLAKIAFTAVAMWTEKSRVPWVVAPVRNQRIGRHLQSFAYF
jgi:hypothetical protein